MSDEAAADFVTPYKEILAKSMGTAGILGSIYAINPAPERRSVMRISGEAGNYKAERVTDYNEISKVLDEIRQYSDKEGNPAPLIREEGDVDLSFLDIAWDALVSHFHETDDRVAVLGAMRAISALKKTDTAAGNTFTCEYCDRDFASQDAAIKHLATVHANRETQTKMKTERD